MLTDAQWKLQLSDIEILASTKQGIEHLLTLLEALYIREINPELNRKNEYPSRVVILSFNCHSE